MKNWKLTTLTFVLGVFPGLARAQQVGDMVIVRSEAQVRVRDEVKQTILRGVDLKVFAVDGDWLWISHKATGWLKKEDVTTPTNALEVFTEQIRQNPNDTGAYIARGMTWHTKGETRIAIGDYDEAIRIDPKSWAAYLDRGVCWQTLKEFDRAISDYTEAIRLAPTDPLAYSNRGNSLRQKGELEKAVSDYTEAIRLAPGFHSPYCNRAFVWSTQGKYEKALSDYTTAIEINSKNAEDYAGRGWVHARLGHLDKALADYDRAVILEPSELYIRMGRSSVLTRKGDYAKAVEDATEATRIDPKNSDAFNSVAWALASSPEARVRDGVKAVEFALKACELTGYKNANEVDTLAAAYAERGDFDAAVKFQAQAAEQASEKHKADFKSRLALYKSHKPYRETHKPETSVAATAQ
jgi:tetratricopeptide (TPR) repeat protein